MTLTARWQPPRRARLSSDLAPRGAEQCHEISGFGERAGRELPGYDPLVQAVGGLMSITGPPETPSKAGVAIVDVVTALYATVAVLAALWRGRKAAVASA